MIPQILHNQKYVNHNYNFLTIKKTKLNRIRTQINEFQFARNGNQTIQRQEKSRHTFARSGNLIPSYSRALSSTDHNVLLLETSVSVLQPNGSHTCISSRVTAVHTAPGAWPAERKRDQFANYILRSGSSVVRVYLPRPIRIEYNFERSYFSTRVRVHGNPSDAPTCHACNVSS